MSFSIEQEIFGYIDGREVVKYLLSNDTITVSLLTYGATIQSIVTPDRYGILSDVVLGFDSLEGYLEEQPYLGCTVGRYANRIAHGKFTIDDIDYQLATNNDGNHIHGGNKGLDKKVWEAESFADDSKAQVSMSLSSPHMEEGYPGNLDVSVTFTLSQKGKLQIDYSASTDKKTIINLTNHSYFNLHNNHDRPILDHILEINSDKITEINKLCIPTGKFLPISRTPLDFITPTEIGRSIDEKHLMLSYGNGYDFNYVLDHNGSLESSVATVLNPVNGKTIQVFTTEPGIQLYTSNWLDGSFSGKRGIKYNKHGAVCLETQHYPDSPNHPHFPSTLYGPYRTFKSTTIYTFGVT